MHEIHLTGCASEPLISYLKALGVLRLVATQADEAARGYWRGDGFVLSSSLDREALCRYFLDRYQPTPVVAPWNGGSGFYEGDKTDGIDAISASTDQRLSRYREVIQAIHAFPEMPRAPKNIEDILDVLRARALQLKFGKDQQRTVEQIELVEKDLPLAQELLGPGCLTWGLQELEARIDPLDGAKRRTLRQWYRDVKKARTLFNKEQREGAKGSLLNICRARLSEGSLDWLDAVYALTRPGRPDYAPLLGSGGNEGNLDYTNNFMQHIAALLCSPSEQTASWLENALFGSLARNLTESSIGQYDPGRAGGFNQGQGIETKDFKINRWDFVLGLEGALVLASSVARREGRATSGMASPFTVRVSPVGYASATAGEEAKTKSRAETWMPLWDRPATFGEVRQLFAEGRANVGLRQAVTGIDFARAASSLGVDRGIRAFVRYGFMKRRGDSYVALPIDLVPVRRVPNVELLSELEPVLNQLDYFLRLFKTVPAVLDSARRLVDGALYKASLRGDPTDFQSILTSLGRVQRFLAFRDRSKDPNLERPLGMESLSPRWVSAADDGGAEIRLAAAVAAIQRTGQVGPFRANLLPLDPAASWKWAEGSGQQAWSGNRLEERLAGVLERRMLDAVRLLAPKVPLFSPVRVAPEDATLFIRGGTDDRRIDDLLWGLTLIRWQPFEECPHWPIPVSHLPVERAWALLKLLYIPGTVRGVEVRPEPRAAQLLRAGQVDLACNLARHRLTVSALAPFRADYRPAVDPVRLAAALLIPVKSTNQLENLVLHPRSVA